MINQDRIVDSFHNLYYNNWYRTWFNTTWFGVKTEKCPLDLWVYQEIITETEPDVIIETGTRFGGSSLFLASIFDLMGTGHIITVDVNQEDNHAVHSRITQLCGSSVDPNIVTEIQNIIQEYKRVMVILDSDHSYKHVCRELDIYADFVSSGCYLIVEDTNLNGNPIRSDFGLGPHEAVEKFLGHRDDFEVDLIREKFYLTFNPGGYLKKL